MLDRDNPLMLARDGWKVRDAIAHNSYRFVGTRVFDHVEKVLKLNNML